MKMLRTVIILITFVVAYVSCQAVEGVQVTFDGCKWDSYAEQHKEGATRSPGISTEEDCAKKCRQTDGCSAFDYDWRKKPWSGIHCWLHDDKHKQVKRKPVEGVVFYELQPGSCNVIPAVPAVPVPDPAVLVPAEPVPEPAAPEPTENLQRTVILIKAVTRPDEYIFFRGGIDFKLRPECFNEEVGVRESACSIPIKHRPQEYKKYPEFNSLIKNDLVLDWGSSEPDQGSYKSEDGKTLNPYGTPGMWTTNNIKDPLINAFNQLGDHFWLLDVDMDCTRTEDGWFDFKTFRLNKNSNEGEWENDVSEQPICKGQTEGAPYTSNNHHAKCGALNVFAVEGCLIHPLEE